mgnify:CR=1 FL=1
MKERKVAMNPICTFRPPEALRLKLKSIADKRGITMNALLLQILWQWVKENDQSA